MPCVGWLSTAYCSLMCGLWVLYRAERCVACLFVVGWFVDWKLFDGLLFGWMVVLLLSVCLVFVVVCWVVVSCLKA